jgi:hypothetical protein
MAEAEKVDGLNLTKIEVTAASPDVIGGLMKQITAAVLAAIPEGTIAKVASEIITRGEVIYRQRRCSYSNDTEEVSYHLSNEAKKATIELLKKEIDKQVQAYLGDEAVKQIITAQVVEGMKQAIEQIPAFAAKIAAERIGYTMMGQFDPTIMNLEGRVGFIAEALKTAQNALVAKGTLQPFEVTPL